MDTRTPSQRRRIMQSVKSKNTGPELVVRRALHAMGYRFRLHARELPGKPDIVMRKRKAAIFVHGCFWHRHDCGKGRLPKSRLDYWRPKLEKNAQRDRTKIEHLESLDWKTLVIWECETKDEERVRSILRDFVDKL